MKMNIPMDLFGLAILVIMTAGFAFDARKGEKYARSFLRLCLLMMAQLAADLVFWVQYAESGCNAVTRVARVLSVLCALGTHTQLLCLANQLLSPLKKSQKTVTVLFMVLYGAEACMAVAGLFMGWDFLPDRSMLLFCVIPVLCLLYCFLNLLTSDKLRTGEKVNFSLLAVLYLCGYAAQAVLPETSVSNLTGTFLILAIYVGAYVRRTHQLFQAEAEFSRKQAALMLSQMQPHFLFNSLTSIVDLCDREPGLAKQAVLDFSDYLRSNLDTMTTEGLIPFSKELEHCQTYLRLEKLRFEENLEFVTDISFTDFSLPPLTVQPLLENAVKHGIGHKEGGGMVVLSVKEQKKDILIKILDNGVGFDTKASFDTDRSHIGIENVRSRVESMCGGTLRITGVPGTGTTAEISIPKEGKA